MLIDTHAHLQDKELINDVDDILQKARDAGVESVVCIGYDYESSWQAVEIARKYTEVYAVVGVHPHDAATLSGEIMAELYKMAKEPKVVAIGEIGLDFYRDLSPRELQKKAFIAQIKMAQELYMPIVIHDRDAHQEVLAVRVQLRCPLVQNVVRCAL
jgi:TatD DNase family protein